MKDTWLWIGTGGMTAGLLLVLALGRSAPRERRHHVVVSAFILAIAACAYFAMANGEGITMVGGRSVYYARYIDWVFTTPLLLLGLLTVALPRLQSPDEARDRNALIGTVIGADVLMIVTGAIAALTVDTNVRYAWYAFGCVAFLVVLYAIFVPLRAAARERGAAQAALYSRLLWVLTILWFTYPIVWLIGTEGTKTVSLTTEIAIYAIIDIAAKVGFGLLLVTGVVGLPKTAASTAPTGVPAAAA